MPGARRPSLWDARVAQALGVVIRRRREAAGLTQEALEASSSVHVTHLRGIESGRRNPSFEVVWRLALGIGVSLAELGAEVEAELEAQRG